MSLKKFLKSIALSGLLTAALILSMLAMYKGIIVKVVPAEMIRQTPRVPLWYVGFIVFLLNLIAQIIIEIRKARKPCVEYFKSASKKGEIVVPGKTLRELKREAKAIARKIREDRKIFYIF